MTLHVDPPLAHTVHIEPLTFTDWDSRSYIARTTVIVTEMDLQSSSFMRAFWR